MIRPAVQIGNPTVRIKSKNVPIAEIGSAKIKNLIADLTDSMKHYNLVGMAAPQIGVNLNVFVTDLSGTETRKADPEHSRVEVFINPRLNKFGNKRTVLMEGCGSLILGQLFGPVKRPVTVTVTAYNEKAERFQMQGKNLMAKVLQHEYDHLLGTICIDKFTDTRKAAHRDELKKKK